MMATRSGESSGGKWIYNSPLPSENFGDSPVKSRDGVSGNVDDGRFLVDAGGGPKQNKKWSSLFGIRPTRKSTFPPVKDIFVKDKGKFSIEIPD